MLAALAILLTCQLVGEVLSRLLSLSVPGPVIGLALLFVALVVRSDMPERVGPTARTILGHLSLLFVPAGVGVVGNLDLLRASWLPILVVLVVSTIAAMLASVGTFLIVHRLTGGSANE